MDSCATWYICKYCFRAFTNNTDMVTHKRLQHPDRLLVKKKKVVAEESESESNSEPDEKCETPKPRKSIRIDEIKADSEKRSRMVRKLKFDKCENASKAVISTKKKNSRSRQPAKKFDNKTQPGPSSSGTVKNKRRISNGKQLRASLDNRISNGRNPSRSRSHKTKSAQHEGLGSNIRKNEQTKAKRGLVTLKSASGAKIIKKKETLTLKEIYGRLSVVLKLRKSTREDFPCRYCGEKFSERQELNIHERNEEKLFELESESSASELRKTTVPMTPRGEKSEPVGHRKIAHVKSRKSLASQFQCKDCDAKFSTKYFLYKHKNSIHVNPVEELTSEIVSESELEVVSSQEQTHSAKKGNKTSVKTGIFSLKCKICGKCFDSAYVFRKHKSTHIRKGEKSKNKKSHQLNYSNTSTEKVYKCRYCQVSFGRLDILEYHTNQIHRKI